MKKKTGTAKTRVMIVDDHISMRAALRTVINLEDDLLLVAEMESGEAAIAALGAARPDIVLMDSSMSGMNGMETTRRLRELQPDLKIIGITLYEETSYLEEMIELGACGYVLKSGSPSEIIKAIRTVAAGGTWFDPSIPRRVRASGGGGTMSERLSNEELEVAKFLANGQTRSEIATSLGLSVAQVDARRQAAMSKLGARNRAELARVAKERGWLQA
jgi:DNA-binding NarL/FixJ family response regulator